MIYCYHKFYYYLISETYKSVRNVDFIACRSRPLVPFIWSCHNARSLFLAKWFCGVFHHLHTQLYKKTNTNKNHKIKYLTKPSPFGGTLHRLWLSELVLLIVGVYPLILLHTAITSTFYSCSKGN